MLGNQSESEMSLMIMWLKFLPGKKYDPALKHLFFEWSLV